MSYVKSNKTDTLVVPIKKAFYFLLESIIKDIVEIVKSKCIDESHSILSLNCVIMLTD